MNGNGEIIPSEPGALMSEGAALVSGIIATLGACVLAFIGVITTLDLVGNLIWFGVALYAFGLFVQFWTAQSYKDGLTVKEVLMALFWFVDTYATIKAGVNRQNFAAAFGGQHIPADQDNSRTLIGEKLALWGGIALTVFGGLPLIGYGIGSVVSIAFNLIWLFVALFFIGMVVTFWATKAYKNGLTGLEIFLSVAWILAICLAIREGVKAQKAIKTA